MLRAVNRFAGRVVVLIAMLCCAPSLVAAQDCADTAGRMDTFAAPVVVGACVTDAGGLVARWAQVQAENACAPLPVHTLLTFDTPHRGAHISPKLQAVAFRYGTARDRQALGSAAARTLLTQVVTDIKTQVRWRSVGLPLVSRAFPATVTPESAAHKSFFERLRNLNDRNGYPKNCRLVAVANSPRRRAAPTTSPAPIFRVWLPGSRSWTHHAEEADACPGSLRPGLAVRGFRQYYPFGIAGAKFRDVPTFLSCESALDAAPDDAPPFDAWFALPDNAALLGHDDISPVGMRWCVGQIVAAP